MAMARSCAVVLGLRRLCDGRVGGTSGVGEDSLAVEEKAGGGVGVFARATAGAVAGGGQEGRWGDGEEESGGWRRGGGCGRRGGAGNWWRNSASRFSSCWVSAPGRECDD